LTISYQSYDTDSPKL